MGLSAGLVGTVEDDGPGVSPKHVATVEGETATREFPVVDQFAGETDYFSDCILNGRDPEPGGEEGLLDVRVPLHTPERQGAIVNMFETVDAVMTSIGKTGDQIRKSRSNLLTALLSGEHAIPESYDEVMGVVPEVLRGTCGCLVATVGSRMYV